MPNLPVIIAMDAVDATASAEPLIVKLIAAELSPGIAP
jgi:hypothetical protein